MERTVPTLGLNPGSEVYQPVTQGTLSKPLSLPSITSYKLG